MADSTIGTGKTYTTIASWEAATDNDLVGTTTIERGLLNNETFSELVNISGATTNASYYRELTTDTGASFVDNANVRTNPLAYDATKGAAIASGSGYSIVVLLDESYARATKLQIQSGASTSRALWLNASNCSAKQCIADSAGAGGYGSLVLAASGSTVENCLIVQRGSSQFSIAYVGGAHTLTNNTFATPSGTAAPTHGIYYTYAAGTTITNCAIFGAADVGSASFTWSNCYTDDNTSLPSGVTNLAYDTSTGSGFEATDGSDYRIKSTSALKDAGTSSGAPSIDISGTARGTIDVGCWEFVAAGDTLMGQACL